MTIIETLAENIYRIKIPLPKDLLPYTNSYVLRCKNRNLIIDAGMNIPLCKNAMLQSLKDLDIDLNNTDFFVTHFHRDHMGLAKELVMEESKVFMSKTDFHGMVALEKNNWFLPDITEFSHMSGFPETDLEQAYRFFEGHKESNPRHEFPVALLDDDDLLAIGDVCFQCIMTPGHSKGHMCLYDPVSEFLFAGDHLLGAISPTIQGRFNEENPLKDYFDSLEKIYPIEVKKVLPGHGRPFNNAKARITELQTHHVERTEQILRILTARDANVYTIASLMSWNIRADSWENYAPLQRFFAMGETISHLNFLTTEGKVRQKIENHQFIYSLAE